MRIIFLLYIYAFSWLLSLIIGWERQNIFISEQAILDLKTIGQFNSFFINNKGYYIHDCTIEIENHLKIGSHDDGEVSIQFNTEQTELSFIHKIFDTFKLDKNLIEILKNNERHYISIDKESRVLKNFVDFDDYIKNGRK